MKKIILLSLVLVASLSANAQLLAVKTDAALDLMRAANVGIDVAVGNRSTLGASLLAMNGTWGKDCEAYAFQPEYRYYFSGRAMHQHYLGLGGLAAHYNEQRDDRKMKAVSFGAGLIFGYTMHVGNRWNIDFHAGCGLHVFQKKVTIADQPLPEGEPATTQGMFAAPTSLGVSISYVIK